MEKWLKYYLIVPFCIVLGTVSIFALYLWSTNFTPRMYFYSQHVDFTELGHSSVSATIQSSEAYLGILSFSTVGQSIESNAETLIVTLIKDGEEIHTNTYNAHDLVNRVRFPFGFPIQKDSKGQTYEVRLTVHCFEEETCVFSPSSDEVIVRHYFSPAYLLANTDLIFEKIYNNFLDQGTFISSIVLLTPLTVYTLALVYFSQQSKRILSNGKKLLLQHNTLYEKLTYVCITAATLVQKSQMFTFALLVILLIIQLIPLRLRETMLLRLLILTYSASVVFLLIGITSIAEQLSIWTFCFFVFYISQLLQVPTFFSFRASFQKLMRKYLSK